MDTYYATGYVFCVLEVVWEIATDDKFTQVINTGKVQTASAQDFTVKVDADKLKSGQTYYYRF